MRGFTCLRDYLHSHSICRHNGGTEARAGHSQARREGPGVRQLHQVFPAADRFLSQELDRQRR